MTGEMLISVKHYSKHGQSPAGGNARVNKYGKIRPKRDQRYMGQSRKMANPTSTNHQQI